MKRITSTIFLIMALISVLIINSNAVDTSFVGDVNYVSLIIDAAVKEDYDIAEYYTSLRNQKIYVLGIQETYKPFNFDDLFCYAATTYKESGGGAGVSDDEMLAQCNVISNRINDPRFPDTTREVLEARNQYSGFSSKGVYLVDRGNKQVEIDAIIRSYYIAARALNGERAWNGEGYCPETVVWASRSIQGKIWWHTPNGTYFCY